MKVNTGNINSAGMNLEKFMAIKQGAQSRLQNEDLRFNLSELIKQKKDGGGVPTESPVSKPVKTVEPSQMIGEKVGESVGSALNKANELLLYTMDSRQESKTVSKQVLGNYVDLTA